MLNRRDLLNRTLSAGAASLLVPARVPAEDEPGESPGFRIIDSNVSLFRWPFRRLPLDDPDALVRKLRSLGITQAWAGSFEGILHRDIAGVNRRLTEACRSRSELIPIGSINPTLPGWNDDLHRCVEVHNMPGIRLHPNYHGFTLHDPRFVRLLNRATELGCLLQIAAAMEDPRTQHPAVTAPDVDLTPLTNVLPDVPEARIQILNARPRPMLLERLVSCPGIFFDTARVEGTDGVPRLVESVPPGRVLFGTHAPFLIPEAALIRVHESGLLDAETVRAVLSQNAEQLFAGPGA